MGDATGPWQLPPYSLKLMLTEGIIFATALFRKQDWFTVGGYDETLYFREDHDFWLKIALNALLTNIHESMMCCVG